MFHRFLAQEDIFANRPGWNQGQFLVNNGNALLDRFLNGTLTQFQFLAIIDHGAFIGSIGINTGKDLHQGGFACAILSTDAMDFTTTDLERNIIQCHHTWKSLGYMLEIENNFIIHCALLQSA